VQAVGDERGAADVPIVRHVRPPFRQSNDRRGSDSRTDTSIASRRDGEFAGILPGVASRLGLRRVAGSQGTIAAISLGRAHQGA
jgi:hypothetical protein